MWRSGVVLALACSLLGCGRTDREPVIATAAGASTGSVRPALRMARLPRSRPGVAEEQAMAAVGASTPVELHPPLPPTPIPDVESAVLPRSVPAALKHAAAELGTPVCDCFDLFCPERIESCGRLWPASTAGMHGAELVYSASIESLRLPQFEPKERPS